MEVQRNQAEHYFSSGITTASIQTQAIHATNQRGAGSTGRGIQIKASV
jgi:hypothetical protein